jgi:TBC1 domain family protein 5
MRSTNRRLGESIGWIVDTLLQDEGGGDDQERVMSIRNKKREAVECLSYVRDVLNNNVTEFEEDRLFGEEEIKRRISKKGSLLHVGNSSLKPKDHVRISLPKPAAPAVASTMEPPRTTSLNPSHSAFSQSSGRSFHSISNSTSALPAGSPTLTPLNSNPTPTGVAPWNYTRSNFGASPSSVASLPRLPPPTVTSTAFHPYHVPSPHRTLGDTNVAAAENAMDQSSPRKTLQDPLGVLP